MHFSSSLELFLYFFQMLPSFSVEFRILSACVYLQSALAYRFNWPICFLLPPTVKCLANESRCAAIELFFLSGWSIYALKSSRIRIAWRRIYSAVSSHLLFARQFRILVSFSRWNFPKIALQIGAEWLRLPSNVIVKTLNSFFLEISMGWRQDYFKFPK